MLYRRPSASSYTFKKFRARCGLMGGIMSFFRDLKIAMRSLARARALWITVAVTLALGIGANAAIFSVIRGVLLRPLANRDEDRLLYIRQSAPGIGDADTAFSVPELKDIGTGLKTIKALGTLSA